ncbi:MAG: MFS transporter [Pseudomonadota bacterium]
MRARLHQQPTLARILLYAVPALPLAAMTLPLYILVPTFYTETLGLPLAAVGAALLFVRIFDAVNDPIVGFLADRWRPTFGRRRALMACAVPMAALSAFMIFYPPADASVLYLAVWGTLLTIGYTGTVIPYFAWGAELASDYKTRTTVAGWREAMTLTGTLIAIALPFSLQTEDPSVLHGLALLGIVVAVTLPILSGITIAKLPEPVEYSKQVLGFKEGWRYLSANRPFLRLLFAFFLNGLANGIPATLFLYFVSDIIGDPDRRGPLLFLYFLCAVAGVPAASWAARKFGKHRAWAFGMCCAIIVFAPVTMLGEGDLFAYAIICAVSGFFVGFDLSIPPAIQADVIDIDTANSGEQRSGLYFAAWSLATKMSLALGVGVAFPLLAFFGFEAGAGPEQDAGALFALAVIYGWIPITLKIAAISLIWSFPIDEAMQKDLRAKIEQGPAPSSA